ncbi:MAG: hypothetical protein SWZ49_07280 [Cyanobacteriota bacterium]|nr:hypothetical protein [Cyanobacteriota bacterium]
MYSASEQDARTTTFSIFSIIQFSCTSTYIPLPEDVVGKVKTVLKEIKS